MCHTPSPAFSYAELVCVVGTGEWLYALTALFSPHIVPPQIDHPTVLRAANTAAGEPRSTSLSANVQVLAHILQQGWGRGRRLINENENLATGGSRLAPHCAERQHQSQPAAMTDGARGRRGGDRA